MSRPSATASTRPSNAGTSAAPIPLNATARTMPGACAPSTFARLAEASDHRVIATGRNQAVAASRHPSTSPRAPMTGWGTDVAACRVTLRVTTKLQIEEAAPKTPEGDFIDPNTGQAIPRSGPFHYGHKPGFEWWRTQKMAREEGWTRQQVIEYGE